MAFSIGEACTGCTACARSCPVFAISGERGARHSINEKRCVACGVCGRVCPAGAVRDADGRPCAQVKRGEWEKPAVDTAICSACSICVDICTPGALRISMPAFRGDIHVFAELDAPNKCVACGLCEKSCPVGAIAMRAAAVPAPGAGKEAAQ